MLSFAETFGSSVIFVLDALHQAVDSAFVCTRLPSSPSCSIMADGLQPELSAVCDDAGACCTGWNQHRLSASSSRVILTSRRASTRERSSQTIGYFCIIQLTQLPAAERSILTPLHFVWRHAVLQRSLSYKSVHCRRQSLLDVGGHLSASRDTTVQL